MAFLLGKSGKLSEDSIGLTVNAVTPGLIGTEMVDPHPAQGVGPTSCLQIPCHRLGRPEEVARVVHFLACRRVLVHHRGRYGRQRRHGHVTAGDATIITWDEARAATQSNVGLSALGAAVEKHLLELTHDIWQLLTSDIP